MRDLNGFLKLIKKMPADIADKRNARRRFVTFAHFYKPHEDAKTLLYFTEPEYDVDIAAKLFRYQLDSTFNPQSPGVRKFAPVPDKALAHRFLQHLIEAGFHVVPLKSAYRTVPIEVEVQFIRYEPRRDTEALGTPPTIHQDNDWAFCVFLLEWENVEGPINAFVPVRHTNKPITDVPESETVTISLTQPLEGYCVEDTKVAHYVGPVRLKQGAEYGRRTIVILSYKPLVPLRPADVKEMVATLRGTPDALEETPRLPDILSLDARKTTGRRKKELIASLGGQDVIKLRHALY